MICDAQETELQTARFQIVLASRLAQITPPVDGVTPSTDDLPRITDDAERAKRMGFGAKLCIHPKQVALVQAAFMPTEEEVHWAQRVIEADQASKGGAVKLDGKMIDRPVVLLAKRTLAIAGKH
jgi:citrate lyase subunit beta/citryl-CoA lyase